MPMRRSLPSFLAIAATGAIAFAPPASLMANPVRPTVVRGAPSPPLEGAELGRRFDRYFGPGMRGWSGAVLVVREGRPVLKREIGAASSRWDIPFRTETRAPIASITKTFTAAAALLLRNEGRLGLDDPISRWLPDFPSSGKITVADVLGHSSGVPHPDVDPIGMRPLSLESLISVLAKQPPWFEPGTSSRYSNGGYLLLARIVEIVSGISYERFVRERILGPLRLERTGFLDRERPVPGLAEGYFAGPPPAGRIEAPSLNPDTLVGSGGIYSTAEDLAAWGGAAIDGRPVDWAALTYPFGWGRRTYQGRPAIEQSGEVSGYTSYLCVYPRDRVVVVCLANMSVAATAKMGIDIGAMLFGAAPTAPVRPAPFPRTTSLGAFPGVYRFSPDVSFTITAARGSLYLLWAESDQARWLEPSGEGLFFDAESDGTLRFRRDGSAAWVFGSGVIECPRVGPPPR